MQPLKVSASDILGGKNTVARAAVDIADIADIAQCKVKVGQDT